MREAKQQLDEANAALSAAAMLLSAQRETFARFLRESADMDNFGHIVDPTLWNNSERRAMDAILKPLYQAALTFLRAHDIQIEAARAALSKVSHG